VGISWSRRAADKTPLAMSTQRRSHFLKLVNVAPGVLQLWSIEIRGLVCRGPLNRGRVYAHGRRVKYLIRGLVNKGRLNKGLVSTNGCREKYLISGRVYKGRENEGLVCQHGRVPVNRGPQYEHDVRKIRGLLYEPEYSGLENKIGCSDLIYLSRAENTQSQFTHNLRPRK
jgi:hypothetical protein